VTKWQKAILVFVALATASGGYLVTTRRLSAQESPTTNVQLVAVRRGNLLVTATTVGSIVLPRQANLSFGVAGTIATILVSEGDVVKEGQALARLDDIPSFQSAVTSAQANLKQAQKNLEDARKQAPTAVPQAEQAVANARVSLQSAQEALEDAKVADPVTLAQREQAVANAKLALQNANEALGKAKVVDTAVLAQREQAVAGTRVALENAQQAVADAGKPFTDDDLADAKASVLSAQRNWELAKQDIALSRQTWATKVAQAEETYAAALDNYRQKMKAYWGVDLTESQASQDPTAITPDPQTISLWATFLPMLDQDAMSTSIRTVWQAFVAARDNRDSVKAQRDKANVAAEQAERVAGANSRKAQETLATMVVDPLQLALKQSQVASMQADLQKALDDLTETKKGPDPLDVAVKQSLVAVAEANLQKAVADLAEVKKGPDPLNVALKQAQALTAQATLQKALDDLADAKLGPDPVLVELRTAQVASAQDAVNTAKENLASATLTAPFGGVINSITPKVGERVNANTTVTQIVDTSYAEVRATLDEVDLARVKPGQRATVAMDAMPNIRISASVAFVALVGTRTSGVVTYPLKVTLTAPSGATLRDGVTANVTVIVEQRQDVLLVPTRALKRQGREWVAQVMVNGKAENRLVTVGSNSDQTTEVTSGLSEGDQVVVAAAATRTSSNAVPGVGVGGGALGGGMMIPGGFR